MEKKIITVKDVAKKAGVSVATASRALGNYGYVGEAARQKVLEVAKELGYNHNLLAKSLRTRKTFVIGYLLPDIANPFYAGIARGIQDIASERGYTVLLYNNDNDITKTRQFVKLFLRNRAEGIIFSTPFNEALKEMAESAKKIEIPVINCYGSSRIPVSDTVTGDTEGGCYKATRYLLELGHRRIAFLKVRQSNVSERRFRGCQKALEEFGVILESDSVVETGDYSQENGYLGAKVLFARRERPSAIFAFSEQLAIGVLKAARESAMKIPQDLSLVSIDDIIGEVLEPPLTSVRIPTYEAGKVAATLLLERIEGHNPEEARTVMLEEKLIVRDSTRGV